MPRLAFLLATIAIIPAISMSSTATAQGGARDRARDQAPDRARDRTPDRTREREVDESRWLDRLPAEDRAALDVLLGYEAPELADDLTWFNGDAATLESLRGKVVVIQSFSTRTTRTLPQRLVSTLGEHRDRGLVLLSLHTPEQADRAAVVIEQIGYDVPVLLDPSGVTSDRFGAFRRPVNIVIDRTGDVRYAGLNDRGLVQAVQLLLAEEHDPNAKPRERTTATASEVRWPTFTSSVGSARDLRGQPSPAFHVAEWMKDEGEPDGRLTVLDFWATWCRPCIRMIPHMNEMALHYGNRVFIVGISDESRGVFQRGMVQRDLSMNGFEYSLGLDPEGRMKSAFAVRGIPHVAVISGDGVVRWQGHPQGLTRDVMDQLVTANEALRGAGGGAGGDAQTTAPPARWQQQNRG